jgi:hypothetical protein
LRDDLLQKPIVGAAALGLVFLTIFAIWLVLGNIGHERRKAVELSREVKGVIVGKPRFHDTTLAIKTRDSILIDGYPSTELLRTSVIGDSIIKVSNSPYCLLIRSGKTIGRYWYSDVVLPEDVDPDSVIPSNWVRKPSEP